MKRYRVIGSRTVCGIVPGDTAAESVFSASGSIPHLIESGHLEIVSKTVEAVTVEEAE